MYKGTRWSLFFCISPIKRLLPLGIIGSSNFWDFWQCCGRGGYFGKPWSLTFFPKTLFQIKLHTWPLKAIFFSYRNRKNEIWCYYLILTFVIKSIINCMCCVGREGRRHLLIIEPTERKKKKSETNWTHLDPDGKNMVTFTLRLLNTK